MASNSIAILTHLFQSTLSVWRATEFIPNWMEDISISIHALRVESDCWIAYAFKSKKISIHALRVESDHDVISGVCKTKISIHALRVESDSGVLLWGDH